MTARWYAQKKIPVAVNWVRAWKSWYHHGAGRDAGLMQGKESVQTWTDTLHSPLQHQQYSW